MAEALVSALTQTVIGNLNKALLRDVKLLWGLEDDLKRLESVFSTIQLVLQDAEVKQRNDRVLQNWLLKLKDVAYDAEDVLDLINTKGLRQKFNSERGKHGHLTSFFSKRNPLLFRLEIARKVKDIRGRLNDIADERHNFELREGVVNNQVGVVESRQTSSLVNESDIFGRDEEREMLVQKLLHDMADQDDLSVCAVWGMGGMGKTTLAQLVYNDEGWRSILNCESGFVSRKISACRGWLGHLQCISILEDFSIIEYGIISNASPFAYSKIEI